MENMLKLIHSSIEKANAAVKTDTPWRMDTPAPQEIYHYGLSEGLSELKTTWKPLSLNPSQNSRVVPDEIQVLSWNIDFMLPHAKSRMTAALDHLQSLVEDTILHTQTGVVIFLQECLQEDLKTISENPWVRQNFNVTDLGDSNWQNGYYGTTTLIDKRLDVKQCFRVHFSKTRMQRDGLFVDLALSPHHPSNSTPKIIRVCNTHLESLALEPPFRPLQLATCAEYMHSSEIHGAVLAGDLNAIQPFDRTLHTENQLQDAYLVLGGDEESSEGHTWGQQAATFQREQFGTSRMDKVFFCGSLEVTKFEKFGAGVEVTNEQEKKDLIDLGFDRPWITDHLGVVATFKVKTAEESVKL